MREKIQQSGGEKKSRQTAFVGVIQAVETSDMPSGTPDPHTTYEHGRSLPATGTGTTDGVAAKSRAGILRQLSPSRLTIVAIRLYRWIVSPWLPQCCRFSPTCSRYSIIAYERHGFFVGTLLTLWRLARCQPFCRGGYEPVPESIKELLFHKDDSNKSSEPDANLEGTIH